MLTMLAADSDWEDEPKDSEEEDLGALGMSVKDADSTGSVDEEDDEDDDDDEEDEDGEEKEPGDEEEPVDGLAALEKMEKELETEEIDVGDEE